jgi:xanthine dehydrogenase large subunit
MTPIKFGISFNFAAFNQAGALVHIYKDGSILINHGGTEMGQGLHTKMLQVAATALGVDLHQVRSPRPAPTRCPTPRPRRRPRAPTSTAAP